MSYVNAKSMPPISVEKEIKLQVVHRYQCNNESNLFGPGYRQCNLTSCTMLADFLLGGNLAKDAKAQGFSEPESLYAKHLKRFGDTIYHNAQTEALKELGIESYYSIALSKDDILRSLRLGIPVVASFIYKGSGHVCLIVGYNFQQGHYYVHDPYGTRHGSSNVYDINVGGAWDIYSEALMQAIYFNRDNKDSGWGRIVTKIKGKATGLTSGI